jgi:hypothetical protein
VKTALTKRVFRRLKTLRKDVTAELNAVLVEGFANCFQKLF